jgi:hypothetical protein
LNKPVWQTFGHSALPKPLANWPRPLAGSAGEGNPLKHTAKVEGAY